MFSIRDVLNFLLFLKETLRYNVGLHDFFEQFFRETLCSLKNMFFLQTLISCITGVICGMNIFRVLSMTLFSSFGAERLVPTSIITAAFLEIIPVFIFIMYLGQYALPASMQIFKMKADGYFDSFMISGVNAVAYVSLAKILATLVVIPMMCTFCCFSLLLGGVISCYIFSDINIIFFCQGYVSFFNGEYIIFCFVKTTFFCVVGCSIASYIGSTYKMEKDEDISKIGIKCFSTCLVFFLFCDFVFNLFFLL